MKKIFIWMSSMHLGGAERSLIGLLESFDYSKYQVDLFLNSHEGELLKNIPKTVNLLAENKRYKLIETSIRQNLKKGNILIFISKLFARVKAKRKSKNSKNGVINGDYNHKYTKWLMPKIQKKIEYDLAISFIAPHYFVKEKIKAKEKLAWIHTDYKNIALDKKSQEKMWRPYDFIVGVSQDVTTNFGIVFPSLKNKLITIENILSKENIVKQSLNENLVNNSEQITLLSIGRFCEAKNFDNIPYICKKILDMGIDVKWYIIGYGSQEQIIKDKIKVYNVEYNVIILGKKENPYPYINACDIYVQPSRYEGKAVTVREAQILEKPVIITNFSTATSQLEDGVDGIIVPLDNDLCAKGIYDFINNKELQEKIKYNISKRDYSNKQEIEKIYSILEEM